MSARVSLLVIVASTRPERAGDAVTEWATARLGERDDVEVEVADLRAIGLPLLDEPEPAATGRYVHDHTRRWSRLVGDADGFVFVLPEYNRGAPGSVKNALDFLLAEWRDKPAGFVSYSGGPAGGVRAVQATSAALTAFSVTPISAMVNLPRVASLLVDGQLRPPDGADEALDTMAEQLVDHARILAPLRS